MLGGPDGRPYSVGLSLRKLYLANYQNKKGCVMRLAISPLRRGAYGKQAPPLINRPGPFCQGARRKQEKKEAGQPEFEYIARFKAFF